MKKRPVRVAVGVTLAAIGFVVTYYLISNQPLRFGANEAPQQQGWLIILYGYVVTVVGVLLGAVYRGLQLQRQQGSTSVENPKAFARGILLSIDLWMSLCSSPIVYALIWKSLEGGNAGGLTIIALQNGFCCQTVLSSLLKSGDTQKPRDNGSPATGF